MKVDGDVFKIRFSPVQLGRCSERQVDVALHLAAAEAVDHGDHRRVFVQLVLLLLQLRLQLTLLQLQRRRLENRKCSTSRNQPGFISCLLPDHRLKP